MATDIDELARQVALALKVLNGNGKPQEGLAFQVALLQRDMQEVKAGIERIENQLQERWADELAAVRREAEYWRGQVVKVQPIHLSQSQVGERASVGQSATGHGVEQAQPSNAVNRASVRAGGE